MYNKYSVTVNQTFIVVLKYYFETEIIAKVDTTAKNIYKQTLEIRYTIYNLISKSLYCYIKYYSITKKIVLRYDNSATYQLKRNKKDQIHFM